MAFNSMRFCLVLLSVWLFSALFACSHSEKSSADPSFYLTKARKHIKNRNYAKARESLKKLKESFFYGSWSSEALLLRADIDFHQEKYPSAIRHYHSYMKTYPFKKKGYVLFQIGMSYKNQLPYRVVQDLRLAEPALEAFHQILKISPASNYKAKALEAIKHLENKQAEKDLRAILFYKKLGWFNSGLLRLRHFIKTHPESPLMPKALLAGVRMVERGVEADPKNFKHELLLISISGHKFSSLRQDSPDIFKQMLKKMYPDSPEFKKSQEKESFFSNWRTWLL